MLFRTIAITAMLVACGDDLLDIDENTMRVIATQIRGTLNNGASQCRETARQTAHADLHMSGAEVDALSDMRCLSLPAKFTCMAETCTCHSEGIQDNDGNYSVPCSHTAEDERVTRKTFKFDADEIASIQAPSDTNAPADDDTLAPDVTPPADPIVPDPPSSPSQPEVTAPSGETGSLQQCQNEGSETLRWGELLFQLATATPRFTSDEEILTMTCSSSESGLDRNLRCESSACACTATFRLNIVPRQAACVGL